MRTIFALLLAGLVSAGCSVRMFGTDVLDVGSEKDKDGKPVPMFGTVITVHQYGAAAIQPPPSPPGTPPLPPQVQPPPTPKKIDGVDDPTKRAFVNQSASAVRLQIDGTGDEVQLAPYQSTADISFKPGEHRVRVTIERPTANFGTLEITRFIVFSVRPEDRWQPIYVGW